MQTTYIIIYCNFAIYSTINSHHLNSKINKTEILSIILYSTNKAANHNPRTFSSSLARKAIF